MCNVSIMDIGLENLPSEVRQGLEELGRADAQYCGKSVPDAFDKDRWIDGVTHFLIRCLLPLPFL